MPKASSEGSEVKHVAPSPPAVVMETDENDKEEDEVSEDDWDAFQSFPVSKNEDEDDSETEHTAEGKGPDKISSESSIEGVEFQECSISKSINNEKELKGDECVEAVEEKHHGAYPATNKPLDNNNQKMEDKLQNSVFQEERTSISGNELVSGDQKLEVEAEMEEKLQDSGLQQEGTSITENEPVSSDHKSEVESEMEENLQNSGIQEEQTSIPDNQLGSGDHDEPEVDDGMEENLQNSRLQEEGTSIPGNEVSSEEEKLQNSGIEKEGPSIPENELNSCDQKPEVEVEGSIEDEVTSDSVTLQQGVCEPSNNEQHSEMSESPIECTKLEPFAEP